MYTMENTIRPNTGINGKMEIVVNAYQNSIYYIGKILVSNLVVPFIASSFILLAAVLGAISLVKERTE